MSESTKLKPVDVVVVGIGVAGSIMCKELAETGVQVVGLERGRMIDPQREFTVPYAHDEFKHERHNDLLQNLSRETITFRNYTQETALPMREIGSFKPGECVGGAGVHWGGTTFRFLPWDFEMRSKIIERYGKSQIPEDCTSQDWGITYEELEPYYDQFEYLYGISGKAGNLDGEIQPGGNPFEGRRSREFPNPPPAITYTGLLFSDAARSLGYTPFPKPTAAMTQPYINPYKLMLGTCMRGGFCTGFNCAAGARGTPLTAVLPALLKHKNFELRANANVLKVNLDSDKRRAVSVTYVDARGRKLEQPADLIILASYVFNNARLMLLSGIGKPYDPVNNNGVVGRNYSYQTQGKAGLFFEDKVFNRFMGGGGAGMAIDEFNGDHFDHTGLGFIGGAHIAVQSSGAPPIKSHPLPPGTPHWGGGWKRAVAQYYDRSLVVSVSGACQSYRSHYLDLDPTYRDAYGLPLIRLTFDWHENEKKMSAYFTQKAGEIAKAIGKGTLSASPKTGKYSIVPYQSTHNVGGAIMGADPATSAVNKYLQSWDVANVFVVGASAFPHNSANPPTGTVGALACWAADAIKDQYQAARTAGVTTRTPRVDADMTRTDLDSSIMDHEARLSYVELNAHPELREATAIIANQKARGDVDKFWLSHTGKLYRTLLYSPGVALGWLELVTAIRSKTTLLPADQELVILLVAMLNGSASELKAHTPLALAKGITQAQLDALADWERSSEFDAHQRSMLAYTSGMTRGVEIPHEVFEAVRESFDVRQLVELTATIAFYNFVTRFTVALHLT